jgi:hypothetical protein
MPWSEPVGRVSARRRKGTFLPVSVVFCGVHQPETAPFMRNLHYDRRISGHKPRVSRHDPLQKLICF